MSFSIAPRGSQGFWAGLLILPMFVPLALAEPTLQELEDASRLASRATFGMSYEQIVDMAEQGLEEWLDEQLDMECTYFVPIEEQVQEMLENGDYDELRETLNIDVSCYRK